jgi:hypothetical protein
MRPQADKPARLVAGAWFGATACLPLTLVWIEFIFNSQAKPWYGYVAAVSGYCVLPIMIATTFGWLLGADILDRQRVLTPLRAMLKGLLVALYSILVYLFLFGLFAGAGMSIYEPPPGDVSILVRLQLFLVGFSGVLVIGLITVGWSALLAGAAAGWLLFLLVPRFHKRVA